MSSIPGRLTRREGVSRPSPDGTRADEEEGVSLLAEGDDAGSASSTALAGGEPSPSASASAPPQPAPGAGAPPPPSFLLTAGAFFALVTIQVALALSFKAAQGPDGKYAFTPAALLVVSECLKFLMSASAFFVATAATAPAGGGGGSASTLSHVWAVFRREAFASSGGQLPFIAAALATLYCVNNNVTFYIFSWADGANINLIKSGSTFISALMMRAALGRQISRQQWSAIAVQACGLVVTQFGATCTGAPLLASGTYLALLFSLSITALCSVWNDAVLKQGAREGVSLNTFNTLLYAAGAALNFAVAAFSPTTTPGRSFFTGFDTPAALGVLLCNSLIGIAVTAVYRYADAVVKTFASACGTAVLFIVGAAVFGVKVNIVVTAGCAAIFAATHLYVTNAAPAAGAAPSSAPPTLAAPASAVAEGIDDKRADTARSLGSASSSSVCARQCPIPLRPYLPATHREVVITLLAGVLIALVLASHLWSGTAAAPAAEGGRGAGVARALLALALRGGDAAAESGADACAAGAGAWGLNSCSDPSRFLGAW